MFYQFNSEIAKAVGVEDAIILHCLYVWIVKNAANNHNLHDGRYWTYNSVEAWQKLLPFMSERTIKRHLAELEKKGIVLRCTDDKNPRDRTMWYTFSNAGAELLSANEYNICPILHLPKIANAKCQSGTMQSAKVAQCNKYNNIIYNNNINKQYKENNNIPNVILLSKKDELSLPNAENANGELDEKQGTASMPEIAAQYQQAPPPTPSPAEAKQAAYARAEEEFRQELKQYTLEFGEDMINDFFNYWSEPNRSKTKMRKDMERTWDTHRRLLTWFRRTNENIMRHGTYIERKEAAKRQSDMESMQRLAAIAARGYSPKQENDEELGF